MSVIEREQTKVTKSHVLHRAADLLEEFGWCQHAPARDEDDWSCLPCDAEAQSFCMTGAIERAVYDLFNGWNFREQGPPPGTRWSMRPPRENSQTPYEPKWNNAPERTRAEVVARLRNLAEIHST